MATITRYLSNRVAAGKSEIYLRLTVKRGAQYRLRTGLFVNPDRFSEAGQFIKPRANPTEAAELSQIEAELSQIEAQLLRLCQEAAKGDINKELFEGALRRLRYPNERHTNGAEAESDFLQAFERCIAVKDITEIRRRHYRVVFRDCVRFEKYEKMRGGGFRWTLGNVTADDLQRFENFLRDMHNISEKYPEIFEQDADGKITQPRKRQPKGRNTICDEMRILRAVFNWCVGQELAASSPFKKYKVQREVYGDPIYITKAERDEIADFDLSTRPRLAVQRDIFIFQCLTGPRVGDLIRLTESNIIGDALVYIPSKTRGKRAERVLVPLTKRAAAIVEKYKGRADGRLLPFLKEQSYNRSLKEIFTICGMTRNVTKLNSVTREEEQVPLNEYVSSHLARRTFIGALYKDLKDPAIISKLSGHVEGSEAFFRYRKIDEDTLREAMASIE